ncbi:MAG: flagellar motor switch protein FliG, partial [Ruminococcus sp.]|nr:flagellar motor switch protein FliG [Ruminococcus sp.]
MASIELKQLTRVQRAAIVVTAIGSENASEVYKRLNDDEVEALTLEIAALPFV